MRTISILLIAILASGCLMKVGRFKNFDATAPAGLEVTGDSVSGESCGYFVPLASTPTIESAARLAITKAPAGTTGLRDVKIKTYYGVFLAHLCYEVTGIPVR